MASTEASTASAAVRTSVKRESLDSASPKQKQGKSCPDRRLLAMSSTKNQSKPAVAGTKSPGSVPVMRNKASNASATPRALPRRGLTRRRIPKSIIAMAAKVGRRNLATPLQTKIIARIQTPDRKSTRLNSSHANISYAVFCLKKKKTHTYDDLT